MRENLNQLLKDVDNSYNVALLKMTKAMRQTPWMELVSKSYRTRSEPSCSDQTLKFCLSAESERPKTPEVDDVKVSRFLSGVLVSCFSL